MAGLNFILKIHRDVQVTETDVAALATREEVDGTRLLHLPIIPYISSRRTSGQPEPSDVINIVCTGRSPEQQTQQTAPSEQSNAFGVLMASSQLRRLPARLPQPADANAAVTLYNSIVDWLSSLRYRPGPGQPEQPVGWVQGQEPTHGDALVKSLRAIFMPL